MDHEIFQLLSQYAYQPVMVYALVFAMLFASSFGLPLPEEVMILSLGFLAVFMSDLLVFMLGRKYGSRMLRSGWFRRLLSQRLLARTRLFARKFGSLAAGVFRFTLALRFPGHFSCGMFGVQPWKFCLIDGVAGLISVPTQVYLVYFYGDEILTVIERFKIALLVTAAVATAAYILWRRTQKKPAV